VTKITEPGVYDLTLPEYLGQPCDALSIGSSDAQTINESTPKHLRQRWIDEREQSKEADLGTIIHALILEPHRATDGIVIVKADNFKGGDARKIRDAAYEAGKIPILEKDMQRAHDAVRAVQEDPIAAELLSEGEAERSWFAKDEVNGLYLKARPDFFTKKRVIIDVKSVGSTDDDFIGRRIDDGGWFMQAPWYCDVVERIDGEPAHGYCWICVEQKPPHDVVVRKPTMAILAHGHRLNQRAIKIVAQCNRTGIWPGNGGAIKEADLPTYAYYRLEESALREESRSMEAARWSRELGSNAFG
jgi:hypothetical protein